MEIKLELYELVCAKYSCPKPAQVILVVTPHEHAPGTAVNGREVYCLGHGMAKRRELQRKHEREGAKVTLD